MTLELKRLSLQTVDYLQKPQDDLHNVPKKLLAGADPENFGRADAALNYTLNVN